MDAYSLNLTTGALTKNGTLLTNVMDVKVDLHYDFTPGPIEALGGGTPITGMRVTWRVHDTAADARILAQGPPGLLGASIAAFAGTPSRYVGSSKVGDTVALTNVPATITAKALAGASADGFQP